MAQTPVTPAPIALPGSRPLRLARLPRTAPTAFEIVPETTDLDALAGLLDVTRLRKLRFSGRLEPLAGGGWELVADLGASVVQPCAITLVPVTTRIDERVIRRFLPDFAVASGDEAEIPEDVDAEPLPDSIDPAAVMFEALALALPLYPRAPGAELAPDAAGGPDDAAQAGAAGERPDHPMAALAALRDRLKP